MDQDLSVSFIGRRNNVWIDDSMVTECQKCEKKFSLYVRKHHCRNCGNIFCYNCADKYTVIPEFITDRPDAADYWNLTYYLTLFKGNEERVCNGCYEIIQEKKRANKKIIEIFNDPLPIDDIKTSSDLSVEVKNYYRDYLRNIQYYLPNHKYNDVDRKILRRNSIYFKQHSKYIMHLIKSIDWQNATPQDLMMVIDAINETKNKECNELFCTRTCNERLSCDDCINILYSCVDHLPITLLKYCFDIIKLTPEQVILCHMSFFIALIKNNNTNKLLQTQLYELLSTTKKLIYHTYWFLNNAKETATLQEIENINNFIKLFDPAIVKTMHQEYMFFVGLINNLDDPRKYLTDVFAECSPITLPYDPEMQLTGVDINNIKIKNSYTKPVTIPFETNMGPITLLFKKECILNDVTVLNLMTLCDIILKETLDVNFGVVVYPIMPLTANSGMIEIIDKADTVYNILNTKKTILQYIIEKNETRCIKDVLDRYTYSLVSYTLHSYFLGLGDRHLQNIMVSDDGAIFHIDFGFILGTDAYPLTSSDIKLNSDMLDVIGGKDSTRYNTYLDHCADGITVLRKYFNMFFILLGQDGKFKIKHIEKFVMTRFQPRQGDTMVISELMAIIKQSHDAYSDYIRDFLHHHTQQKTVQNGVTKVIKTAFGVMKNFTNSGSK